MGNIIFLPPLSASISRAGGEGARPLPQAGARCSIPDPRYQRAGKGNDCSSSSGEWRQVLIWLCSCSWTHSGPPLVFCFGYGLFYFLFNYNFGPFLWFIYIYIYMKTVNNDQMAKIIISCCSVHFKRFYLSFLRQPGFCLFVHTVRKTSKFEHIQVWKHWKITDLCVHTVSK